MGIILCTCKISGPENEDIGSKGSNVFIELFPVKPNSRNMSIVSVLPLKIARPVMEEPPFALTIGSPP
jgi:hypothetical protein